MEKQQPAAAGEAAGLLLRQMENGDARDASTPPARAAAILEAIDTAPVAERAAGSSAHHAASAQCPGSTGLRVLGVDEVARAKGQDYVTVVYDLDTGGLLWVGDGRSADSFAAFLAELSPECAAGIQAVKAQLPEALIFFDRFHVMKLYSDVIRSVRKADADGKEVIKGSLYSAAGQQAAPGRLRHRTP